MGITETENDEDVALARGMVTSAFLTGFCQTTFCSPLVNDVSGLAVHPRSSQHDASADREGEREREIEEGDGSEA